MQHIEHSRRLRVTNLRRPGWTTSPRPAIARAGRLWLFGVLLIAALSLAGCAKAQAKAAADGPPLQVPEPPPRVLAPPEEPLASAPLTPEAETPPATAPRTPATRPPVRRPPNAANTPEPEPRQEPAPTPPVAAQPTPPPAEPPRELRPALSAADAAEERKVRDVLARAARDLNRVDYQRLSTQGRSQYDQSKRFSDQAEQAIKDRNYVFATTLADKAAALAAELLGR